MGFGTRLGMAVVMAAVVAIVGGAVWYLVVPTMYGTVQDNTPETQELIGDAADGLGNVVGGLGDAAEGLGNVVGELDGVVGDLGDAASGIGGAVSEFGEGVGEATGGLDGAVSGLDDAADGIGGAVAGIVPDDGGGPAAADADAGKASGEYFIKDRPGYRESTTHRHVMYPPCSATLDEFGKETRTVFGIPTGAPIDGGGIFKEFDPNYMASQGFAPKPCAFDRNGNNLGDGWEDQNNDGYADGFTDCTKPYVLVIDEDGLEWYVRELGRDCKYGAPPARAYDMGGSGGSGGGQSGSTHQAPSSSSSSSTTTTTTTDRGDGEVPYGSAIAGTVTRVIDGDTIVVNGDTTIRLTLVDTPERGEEGYEDAAAFTRSACPVGTTVIYDMDDGQRGGSYGRVIALVWCSGLGAANAEIPLNSLLLSKGHAEIVKRYCNASEFGDDEWALRGGC